MPEPREATTSLGAEGLQNALWWLGGPAREHRTGPRLLSDNGSNCVADDLAEWLDPKGMQQVRGAPYVIKTRKRIRRSLTGLTFACCSFAGGQI